MSSDEKSPSSRRTRGYEVAGVIPIDWSKFWEIDRVESDWCIEPILPNGRQAGVFSTTGHGKSLLALDVSAAMACGRSVLGHAPRPPMSIVYFDLEMTSDDVRDRLRDLDYGPNDDLSNLHYYQLPAIPPLDSREGGEALMAIVEQYQPRLVVLDTMAAIVEGEENSADTYRDFFRYSGRPLKAAGVSLLRLDHAGKDPARGQRGSSSKSDELDVVWQLTTTGDQVLLTNKKRRVPYVPDRVALTRQTEPVMSHIINPAGWPSGTREVAQLLDDLGVVINAKAAVAAQALKEAGQGRRRQVVFAAQKLRKERELGRRAFGNETRKQIVVLEPPGAEPTSNPRSPAELNSQVKAMYTVPGTNGNHVDASEVVNGNLVPPRRGEPLPDRPGNHDHTDESDCNCVGCGKTSPHREPTEEPVCDIEDAPQHFPRDTEEATP